MTAQFRSFAAMLIVTVLAAGLAGWWGVNYRLKQTPPDLDRLLHEKLDLTNNQERQIESLEGEMEANRERLRNLMREANRELAAAMARDHAFGPAEKTAIGHFHQAMIELQEDTVKHVMAMRAVLNPSQAQLFDQIITKNLAEQ